MGGSESTLSDVSGFRLVQIWKGSPAHHAGLELFFDHVVELDGVSFVSPSRVSPSDFSEQARRCVNRTVRLVVYNSRTRAFRDVWIAPRRWSTEVPGLLGASVRFAVDVTQPPSGLRVLEVFPESPASNAGLLPESDFLMGTVETDFTCIDDLFDACSFHRVEKTPLSLIVYNSKKESARLVTLTPDPCWGGEGSLGCNVAKGLLHQIPPSKMIHPNSYARYVYEGGRQPDEEGDSVSSDADGVPFKQQNDNITIGIPPEVTARMEFSYRSHTDVPDPVRPQETSSSQGYQPEEALPPTNVSPDPVLRPTIPNGGTFYGSSTDTRLAMNSSTQSHSYSSYMEQPQQANLNLDMGVVDTSARSSDLVPVLRSPLRPPDIITHAVQPVHDPSSSDARQFSLSSFPLSGSPLRGQRAFSRPGQVPINEGPPNSHPQREFPSGQSQRGLTAGQPLTRSSPNLLLQTADTGYPEMPAIPTTNSPPRPGALFLSN